MSGPQLKTKPAQTSVSEEVASDLSPVGALSLYIAEISAMKRARAELPQGQNSRTGIFYTKQATFDLYDRQIGMLEKESIRALELISSGMPRDFVLSECPTLLRLSSVKPTAIPSPSTQTSDEIVQRITMLRLVNADDPTEIPLLAGRALLSKLKPELDKIPQNIRKDIATVASRYGEQSARYEEALLLNEAARTLQRTALTADERRIFDQWSDAFALDGSSFNLRDSTRVSIARGIGHTVMTLPALLPMGWVGGGVRVGVAALGTRTAARIMGTEAAEFLFGNAAKYSAEMGVALLIGRQLTQFGLTATESLAFKELFTRINTGKSFLSLENWKRELFWQTLTMGLASKINKIEPAAVGTSSRFFTSLLGKIEDPVARQVAGELLKTKIQLGGGYILSLLDSQTSAQLTDFEKREALRYLGEEYLSQLSRAIAMRGLAKGSSLAAKQAPLLVSSAGQSLSKLNENLRNRDAVYESLGVERALQRLREFKLFPSLQETTVGFLGMQFSYAVLSNLCKNSDALQALGVLTAWKLYEAGFHVTKFSRDFRKILKGDSAGDEIIGIQNLLLRESIKTLLPHLSIFKLIDIQSQVREGNLRDASTDFICLTLSRNGFADTATAVKQRFSSTLSGVERHKLYHFLSDEIRRHSPDLSSSLGRYIKEHLDEEAKDLGDALSILSLTERKPRVNLSISGVSEGVVFRFFRKLIGKPVDLAAQAEKGTEEEINPVRSELAKRISSPLATALAKLNYNDASVEMKNGLGGLGVAYGRAEEFTNPVASTNPPVIYLRLSNSTLSGTFATLAVPIRVLRRVEGENDKMIEGLVSIPLEDIIRNGMLGSPEKLASDLLATLGKNHPVVTAVRQGIPADVRIRHERTGAMLRGSAVVELKSPGPGITVQTTPIIGGATKSFSIILSSAVPKAASRVNAAEDPRTKMTIEVKLGTDRKSAELSANFQHPTNSRPAFQGPAVEEFIFASLIPHLRDELKLNSVTLTDPSRGKSRSHNGDDVFFKRFNSVAGKYPGIVAEQSERSVTYRFGKAARTDIFTIGRNLEALEDVEQARRNSLGRFAGHLLDEIVGRFPKIADERQLLSKIMTDLAVRNPEIFAYRLKKLTQVLEEGRSREEGLLLMKEWVIELHSLHWYLQRRGFSRSAGGADAKEMGLSPSTVFLRRDDAPASQPHAVQVQGRYWWNFGRDDKKTDTQQLLALAKAVEEKKLSSATFEISGRVSPDFVKWLRANVGELDGLIQIVYRLEFHDKDKTVVRLPMLRPPFGSRPFPERGDLTTEQKRIVDKAKALIEQDNFLDFVANLSATHAGLFNTTRGGTPYSPSYVEAGIMAFPSLFNLEAIQTFLADWNRALILGLSKHRK